MASVEIRVPRQHTLWVFTVALVIGAATLLGFLTGSKGAAADPVTPGKTAGPDLAVPEPKPKRNKASITGQPFFRMASLNLRTLLAPEDDGLEYAPDAAPGFAIGGSLSRAGGFAFMESTGGTQPPFALAALNLRTFIPEQQENGLTSFDVLDGADTRLYRDVFAAQEKGDWATADILIEQITDPVLMGHVLYQRYMHPTAYRSSYEELHGWLNAYADHPGASHIYRLALKRRSPGEPGPTRPSVGRGVTGAMESYGFVHRRYRSPLERTDEQREAVRARTHDIETHAERGRPEEAYALLADPKTRSILDAVEYDLSRLKVGEGFFYDRQYARAYALATATLKRSAPQLEIAHWVAGLSAWKLGQYGKAAGHFRTIANSENVSPWKQAAGGVWGARAYREIGRENDATALLRLSARYPGTFYGMVAGRMLGGVHSFHWRTPDMGTERVNELLEEPAGQRALALIQVGKNDIAERELRTLRPVGDGDLQQALVAIAEDAALPALAVRVGSAFRAPNGKRYDTALFPIPPWTPEDGFKVDRALVFGFMRQESRFDPRARSHVGATGLMQLMPRTAGYMDEGESYMGEAADTLFDPLLNIELGQRYLAYLLENGLVRNDLMMLAAAYNAGPGNLQHWRRKVDYAEDPLFFIESIPIEETRLFIEKVLTNIWVYRLRLNQPTPSLDALAVGKRPLYQRLDTQHIQVASHVRY